MSSSDPLPPIPRGAADSPGADDSPFALAELPRRVAAYLIDVAMLALVLGAVQQAISALAFDGVRPEWTRDGVKLWAFVVATVSLPTWCYFTWLDSGDRSGTLGKRWLRLAVVSEDGPPLTVSRSLVRTIFKLLPWELTHVGLLVPVPMWDDPNAALTRPLFMLSTFLVGSWFAATMLTPLQQGPHDLVVRSRVVRRPRSGSR
jgi:uncharacterized RDD family membrane protein YckC